jgi:hypothetical protein
MIPIVVGVSIVDYLYLLLAKPTFSTINKGLIIYAF